MIKRGLIFVFAASLVLGGMNMVSAKGGQPADSSGMTKAQANSLISSGKLKAVKKKSDIPKVYWDAMSLEPMAEIDGDFEAGCTGPGPHTRLIAAAVGDSYACIVSEQGGIAYFRQFRVFKNDNNSVKCVYTEGINQDDRCNEVKKKLAGG